jgi:Siphovirus Gp157
MSAAPVISLVPRTLAGHINEVDAIVEMIDALDDEALKGESREELSARLIGAIAGTKKKVDSTCNVLAMFEHLESAAKAECERLKKRAEYYERQRDRLETYVLAVLTASELDRLDGETSTLKSRANPPSVAIAIGTIVPDEYLAEPKPPVIAPDKPAIKKALLAGLEIKGCSLSRTSRLVRS